MKFAVKIIGQTEALLNSTKAQQLKTWDQLLTMMGSDDASDYRFIVQHRDPGKGIQMVNPYEPLSKKDEPDYAEICGYWAVKKEVFDESIRSKKINCRLPNDVDHQQIINSLLASMGAGLVAKELLRVAPDTEIIVENAAALVLGPLCGFAYYRAMKKRYQQIMGRDLDQEEELLIKKHAAALSFQYVMIIGGYLLAMDAAKFVLLGLNIFPHTWLAHVSIALTLGLGKGLTAMLAKVMSDYALHGKVITSPKEFLSIFVEEFTIGVAFYAFSIIPFSSWLQLNFEPMMAKAFNKTVAVFVLLATSLLTMRTFAHLKDPLSKMHLLDSIKQTFHDWFHKEKANLELPTITEKSDEGIDDKSQDENGHPEQVPAT